MKGRSALLIAGLIVAGTALASAPATARPIDKGHFHDVSKSDVYDCNGTPAQDSVDVSGNFVFNQRGSSPFPYYGESVRGTAVTTNMDTGGTYTNIFTANSRDHKIVDNGDGTITITTFASGSSRFYDTNGKFVLKDPARSGSPSTSTTRELLVTRATTSRSRTRSGSCARPPDTATSPTATSAPTWWRLRVSGLVTLVGSDYAVGTAAPLRGGAAVFAAVADRSPLVIVVEGRNLRPELTHELGDIPALESAGAEHAGGRAQSGSRDAGAISPQARARTYGR